jgi:DNA-binding MarR family transcriptional regulator/CheY-like chemotaxis protein
MNLNLYPEEVASLASYNPDERRISIFADSEAGQQTLQSIAKRLSVRVMFAGSTGEGVERLTDYPAGDAIFVDVAFNGDAGLDVFLDRLDAFGRAEQVPILINTVPECLDQVAARMSAPSVALMSQANAADWAATLAMFATMFGDGRDPVLHEVAIDDSLRLQRLADEVQRIARTLADLVGNEPPPMRGVSDAMIGFRAEPTRFAAPPSAITASDVRAIIRLRRMRDRYFRSDLFADPAWDMLLDLMAARLERMRVAVSSLCIAAAVPPTTALRWIKTMSDNGMFVRVADPEDGRRVFIDLSDGAAAGMNAYLSAAKAQGGLAV